MLTKLLFLMLLSSAAMLGQACNATADQCKDPVTHPIHDNQRHCTCFTCQTGTPDEKVLCASDPKEEGRLQARAEKKRIDSGESTVNPQYAQNHTGSSSQSIEGCVNGSKGSYTLTDANGATWQLAGDISRLSDHVGHRVRISGESVGSAGMASSSAGSSGSSASATSPNLVATFDVEKVKMVSSGCESHH